MNKKEIAELLNEGAQEIQSLRRSNQIMGEKLELVEGMLQLTRLRDTRSEGRSIDVVWEMQRHSRDLRAQFEKENIKSETP